MRKNDELADPRSCLNKARNDEWLFVLLGRDAAAPVAVQAWIDERLRLGKNKPDDEQIVEARRWIDAVLAERWAALPSLPEHVTIGEKYEPAMKITGQGEADAYFERCVQHTMSFGKSRADAESIERTNLGYYAGYYDEETRRRVEQLFRCAHPIFGSIAANGPPTPEQALNAGMEAAGK